MIGTPVEPNWDPNTIYQYNFDSIKENIDIKLSKYISDEIYQYYAEEIGTEKVIDFLIVQDRISEVHSSRFFSPSYYLPSSYDEDDYDSDEEDNKFSFKQRVSVPKYNIIAIKGSLVKYFLTELVYDIPSNSLFCNRKDVEDFVKMYELKFLYENVIPLSDFKGQIGD